MRQGRRAGKQNSCCPRVSCDECLRVTSEGDDDDDDDDVFIFTCAPVLGHMTHGEIYLQEGVDIG